MKFENKKGITLVALVITIVILLILAGITINQLTGDNGLFARAKEAAEKTKRASAKERLQTELMDISTEKIAKGEEINLTNLDEKSQELASKGISVESSGVPRNVTLDGYTFKVKEDLTIEGEGIENGTNGSEGSTTGGTTGNSGQIDFYGEKIPSAFAGGDGSENNPYLIESAAQLVFFATTVNNGYNTYEGKYIKLTNDIQLNSDVQWTPIGNSTTQFQGTFDGNSKTISGIFINNSSGYQGLFGTLATTGTIKNLEVEGNISGAGNIGGIIGVNYGTVIGVKNKIEITSSSYGVGGIAGVNQGMIEQCANFSKISTTRDSVGGIAGNNRGTIKKCYNLGTIYATAYTAGGITGHNGSDTKDGYVYNCYNNASVTAGKSGYVGGITGGVGYNSATGYIYNCYTVKNTTIFGYNYNKKDIQNCYTTNSADNIENLNAGIDDVTANTDTEQPWIADTNNINDGYPILTWQNEQ